jgi:hypothetical protein
MIWQKAFREKAKKVTMRDGSQFVVEYDKRELGLCWIQPVPDGIFAPCGWFRYQEKAIDPRWLSE